MTAINMAEPGSIGKQVKITTDPDIASSFKAACAASGISMASILTQFMADYANTAVPKIKPLPGYSTRRQRRAAIQRTALQLGQIRDCEAQYQERIPENLQGSSVFENSEEFVALLDEAIAALDMIASI